MDISVVILTFNSAKTIERCLESLHASLESLNLEYEVLVVDNGSSDGTLALLERLQTVFGERLDVNALKDNLGTTVSRNMALRKAGGHHVIVMDSDAYVESDSIIALRNHLLANDTCGMAVPAMTYADGRYQISCDQFPTLWRKCQRFFGLKQLEDGAADKRQPSGPIDYAISAFWMFPRSVMEKVGYLDERIFYSPEDVDYCIRIWQAGYSIHYSDQVSVIHDAQEISRPKGLLGINRFTLSHIKGLFYLFIKHRYMWRPLRF